MKIRSLQQLEKSLCVIALAAIATAAFAAPDEELLGKSKGYPIGTAANWFFDESDPVRGPSHPEKNSLNTQDFHIKWRLHRSMKQNASFSPNA